jgi:hypothetical protein
MVIPSPTEASSDDRSDQHAQSEGHAEHEGEAE